MQLPVQDSARLCLSLGCLPALFKQDSGHLRLPGHKGKYSSFIEKYRRHPKMDKAIAKVRHYCHVEYFLLPGDVEPKKVDVVVFPALAKVFLDSGIKTVRPWQERDKVWVSWTQTFNINVTKELLKKINFHNITLRLWDTKDKVSKKVRYYRLKPSMFSEDTGSFGKFEVKHLVLSQRRLSERGIHVKEESRQEHTPGKPEKAIKSLKTLQGEWSRPWWGASKPAMSSGGATVAEARELIERPSRSSLATLLEKQKFQIKWQESNGQRKRQRRMKKSRLEEEMDSSLPGPGRQSPLSIQLAMMPLLAGWQTVVSHVSRKSANILDCFLTLKTEVPLMTEEQKQELNPLTIKIKCVSCLPSQPVSIPELERLCMPVYCRYQFHETPVHRTEGQPHGTNVYFQDINVIFLGAMHPSDLREYLEGPPMVVEVHDRDRKSEGYSRKPTLFGEDPLDSYLNLQALISPKETENNPFEYQEKTWDPYGVAQVSFADLLLGHKYLNLVVPVHSSEPKATAVGQDCRSRKAVESRVPRDGLQCGPMPTGNYLEASTLLKLRVDVAVPLRARPEAPETTAAQFGRIIFVFDSRKISLLLSLLQDITVINARALDLGSYPLEDMQQILSAFKLRVKIQERQDLDVLTGFHLLDGSVHLLILEGLADQGLKQLWEGHQSRVPQEEQGGYKVLYNSELRFRSRLYADLETVLYHVRLFQPLAWLMKHAALYVRNAVPQPVFQALNRIYCICQYSTRLRDVVTGDLLPSSAMIKELSQEFGLPISQEDLTEGKLLAVSPPPAPKLDFRNRKSTLTAEIQEAGVFLQKNITEAYQVIKKPPKSVMKVIRITAPAKNAVYNYSIQTLNSVELAKKELYREMGKEPRKRFTYSQNYLSAMVEPQDTEEEKRKATRKSRQAWLTPSGFQVAGLHNMERTPHLGLLPPIGTVTEEWREKALFANVLEPVLQRERWCWEQRHQDFDLYTQPPPFLELPPPPKPRTGNGSLSGEKGDTEPVA
uniref:Cilia and flagella associated protein 92 (putative) n=1 Tax=Catagonus wagneri TaxID=51154 RepID=A0A8C3X7S5_9CETA